MRVFTMKEFENNESLSFINRVIDMYNANVTAENSDNEFYQQFVEIKNRLANDLPLLQKAVKHEIACLTGSHYFMSKDKTRFITKIDGQAVIIGIMLINFELYFDRHSNGEIYFRDIYPCYKEKVIAQLGGVDDSEFEPVSDNKLLEFISEHLHTINYKIIIHDYE